MTDRLHIVRAPVWGCCFERDNWYYGYRHALIIGPWLIMWGRMTDAEAAQAYDSFQRATERGSHD